MAELRLSPLEDLLSDEELDKLWSELMELGVEEGLPEGDEDGELEESLTDDQLTDFMDRLEASDIGCTIYLPIEFDGVVEVGDYTFGSALTLLDTLEELQEELELGDDTIEDEDEFDLGVIEAGLRHAWRVFVVGANRCVAHQMPMLVIS